MAEVLGLAASGIAVAQLAGAIVGSTQKIYSFYSDVKDAPKKLGDLLVEIELLGEVLVEFYDQSTTPTTGQSKVLPKVLKHCKTVMENLDEILNVLENGLNKDGGRMKMQWRAMKVVLKEKTLKEITERLERAKSLLTLAVDCHNMQFNRAMQQTLMQLSTSGTKAHTLQTNKAVTIRNSNSIQVSKKEDTSLIRQAANSHGLFSYWSTTSVLNQQTKKKNSAEWGTDEIIADEDADMDFDLTILPKAWMRLNGMKIKQSRRFGRWTYSFRPIRVVPDDSPIFDACANGDIGEVLQLVQTGVASVFDTSQEGINLLHVAATHLNASLCRWLIAQGVQATELDVQKGWTALHFAAEFCNKGKMTQEYSTIYSNSYLPALRLTKTKGGFNNTLETFRILVEFGKCDPMQSEQPRNPDKKNLNSLHLYNGVSEGFNYMLSQEEFLVSIDAKDSLGISVLEWKLQTQPQSSNSLKIVCEKDTKFLESRNLKDGLPDCPKALSLMLNRLARSIILYRSEAESLFCRWLISTLLDMGVDVHYFCKVTGTPFNYSFTISALNLFSNIAAIENTCLLITTWLDLLKKAGYNLQEYFLRESDYSKRCIMRSSYYFGSICTMEVFLSQSTTDIIFSFGFYDYRHEQRNFSISQYQQKGKMPGAWEDSDKKSYSSYDLRDVCNMWVNDIRRPSRSPDIEISFKISPLKDGEQSFDHLQSIRRRVLNCNCSWFGECPHEPQFGRCDAETGELDLCSCLDESGCEREYEDTDDDGSEVESQVESIDNSNEDEEGSDYESNVESDNESINGSNEDEEEQKEEGDSEGESEFLYDPEYYCRHCGRKYSGPTSAK